MDCIEIKGVNKYFGDTHILKDVSLSVPQGAVYGLLGPSGCGKTTTVKIMAGILRASSGDVHILGEKMPDLELMKKVGYMAQVAALYQELSASENLSFFASLYGIEKKEQEKESRRVLEIVNLTKEINKPVIFFSEGMKRRLALAITLLHKPKVLLLDEPTVGMDPGLRKEVWKELYALSEEGVTLLVTTHVMDEAEKCTHLAMMREGAIIATGSPKEIIDATGASTLEEAFLAYSEGEANAN